MGHLSESDLCRLNKDWFSRERLKRNRDMTEASEGERRVRYRGSDLSGHVWL